MGTTEQDFWARGWAEGREKDREEIARRLSARCEFLDSIAEITGLPISRVKELKEEKLQAK